MHCQRHGRNPAVIVGKEVFRSFQLFRHGAAHPCHENGNIFKPKMTTATYPIPNGPGRAFTAAIFSFLVADMFVDHPVGPLHEAVARHLVFGYLASFDSATEAERVTAITVKGKRGSRKIWVGAGRVGSAGLCTGGAS